MSKTKKMETPKVKHITTVELEKIKGIQMELQQYLNSIGIMEVQKAKAIYNVNMLENDMQEAKKALEEAYGPININLSDGSYEPVEAIEEA